MKKSDLLKIAKPILFNTDMVRAILEGRKTQTRRARRAPNCKKGDILYVRETWTECHIASPEKYLYRADYDISIYPYSKWSWHPSIHMPKEAARIFLKVTDIVIERLQEINDEGAKAEGIGEFYVGMDETGFALNSKDGNFYDSAVGAYIDLWNHMTPKRLIDKYGWNANPYVMVIEFEKLEVEE